MKAMPFQKNRNMSERSLCSYCALILLLTFFGTVGPSFAEDFVYNIGDSQVAVNGFYQTNHILARTLSPDFERTEIANDAYPGSYEIYANEWGGGGDIGAGWIPVPVGPLVAASGANIMNRANITSFTNGFDCSAASELDVDVIGNLIPQPEGDEVLYDSWQFEVMGGVHNEIDINILEPVTVRLEGSLSMDYVHDYWGAIHASYSLYNFKTFETITYENLYYDNRDSEAHGIESASIMEEVLLIPGTYKLTLITNVRLQPDSVNHYNYNWLPGFPAFSQESRADLTVTFIPEPATLSLLALGGLALLRKRK